MTRPKIDLEKDAFDWVIEILGFLLLGALIIFPLYLYKTLPERISIHYNALGEADSFSSKNTIWILPAIGVVMFVGLTILNRFPHIFNYPTEITEKNAASQYHNATKLIRVLNLLIVGTFFYISIQTMLGARNEDIGLGSWFLPVFFVAILAPVICYIYRAIKTKA